MKQFAVIGLGRFGSSVARTLESLGHQVMGIDRDHARVNQMRHELTHVVEADCTDEEQIRALGLRNFDAVIMAVGGDLQESTLITLLLKEAGVPRVVAKASSDLHGKLLEKIGADQVIYPERDMGVRVAHHILTGVALDSIELSPGYRVVEVPASPAMFGRSLRDLNLRARFRLNVMAIRRGEDVLVNPGSDDVIYEGDILVVAGDPTSLSRLQELEESPAGG
ncbi:potassium channel family protein [Caldinitratiruptor microaerophilus]|uniref:Potassium transporter Trk n=1 Tax=Caldinitratiruptor microaerophilus TaxID=671077 RepID=A0AA35CLY5_9FIRM|nr:TrkA family potassium uptake protein [Caldinitratiruptor microaerophilus]BDG60833.1 potassium transporter Trk [Caldinitratiruptor microaerophilus]